MSKVVPEIPPDYDKTRVIERPDGFYWQFRSEGREAGPFATLIEAIQDMQYQGESGLEPGETVEEAEAELGVSDWIDPETGELAEESVPRLEDH